MSNHHLCIHPFSQNWEKGQGLRARRGGVRLSAPALNPYNYSGRGVPSIGLAERGRVTLSP